MSDDSLSVRMIGEMTRKEFCEIRDFLYPGVCKDRLFVGKDENSELIVVCLNSPDEFSSGSIANLLKQNPLGTFLVIYGPWGDADGRSRDLWPTGTRVPAWRWKQRMEVKGPLPLTATRDEIFAHDFEYRDRTAKSLRVRIDSPDPPLHGLLGEIFEEVERGSTVLFDVDPWNGERRSELFRLQRDEPGVAIVPLVGFPEPGLLQEIRRAGINRSWAKLAPLDQLVRLVCELDSSR